MAEQCLFCSIIAGKIPSKQVYEDSFVVAFLDINPRNPGHTLVVPRKHAATIFEMDNKEVGNVFQSVRNVAIKVLNAMRAQGVNILQSNGAAAGQIVPHVHFHVIPRFTNEGPMSLEGSLQVKKMTDDMLNKIADRIDAAEITRLDEIDKHIDSAIENAVPDINEEMGEKLSKKPAAREAQKKGKKEPEKEDVEEIDFNF